MVYEFSEAVAKYIEERNFSIDVIPKEKRIPEYSHTTVSVKSLSEYMRMIAFLYEFDDSPDSNLAFRGVSDFKYSLSPSLKVYQESPEYSYGYGDNVECRLVDEMLTTRPEEFAGFNSDFDLLAKMQHLGLPTRLLDFSLNPLVALYFACQSLSDTTARILCTRDTSSAYTREIVEKVCGTYKVPEFAQFYLEDLVQEDTNIVQYVVANMEPLMAHPKCISERIRRQSGVFMIFPNAISDRIWYNLTSWEEGNYIHPYTSKEEIERVHKIRNTEDPYEIYELEHGSDLNGVYFDVTSDSFFRLGKYYKDENGFTIEKGQKLCINDSIAWAFKKRFAIEDDVAALSQTIMSGNFCSILIEPEYKRSIMRELNQVNINEAFLFPEPEYTAKRIKNRYLHK